MPQQEGGLFDLQKRLNLLPMGRPARRPALTDSLDTVSAFLWRACRMSRYHVVVMWCPPARVIGPTGLLQFHFLPHPKSPNHYARDLETVSRYDGGRYIPPPTNVIRRCVSHKYTHERGARDERLRQRDDYPHARIGHPPWSGSLACPFCPQLANTGTSGAIRPDGQSAYVEIPFAGLYALPFFGRTHLPLVMR